MQLTNVALHSVTFRIWVVCDLFGEALAVGLVLPQLSPTCKRACQNRPGES